jgi:hypothetical protein
VVYRVKEEHQDYKKGCRSCDKKPWLVVDLIRLFELPHIEGYHFFRCKVVLVDLDNQKQGSWHAKEEDTRKDIDDEVHKADFVKGTTDDDVWRIT